MTRSDPSVSSQPTAPTPWVPRLEPSPKPLYLHIADTLEADIASGRLVAQQQLPTQRALARQLDLNYATISRAYAEAQRRGLIVARVGQGSFVCGLQSTGTKRAHSVARVVDMTMNLPPEPDAPGLLERMQAGLAQVSGDLRALLRYQEFGGSDEDKLAACSWLGLRQLQLDPGRVLVCPGAQSALLAVLSTLAGPGEVVLCEALTYPGLRAIAAQLGIRLIGLPQDGEGIEVDALIRAVAEYRPKALYCNPVLLNPTATVVSLARKAALVQIARAEQLPIIEDDAYGLLVTAAPAPFALLAPELTYYIAGFSKCVGAGLRVAYLLAPSPRHSARLATVLRATTVMASPLTVALTTLWVQDGTAQASLAAVRQESVWRQRLAARLLAGSDVQSHPEAFHLWLRLPEPWNRAAFAAQLRGQRVNVVVSDAFAVAAPAPEAVRICLGGSASRVEISAALELIADTLAQPAAQAVGFF